MGSETSRRRRLDVEMVRRGLVGSREAAHVAIIGGAVLVDGAPVAKAASLVLPAQAIVLVGEGPPFVSRGGHKLEHALECFTIDVAGRLCLDAGVSTGGFTDCLLQRGAARVVAVDVGHGQTHERVRSDPRVTLLERTNVRTLAPDTVEGPFDLIVADLSFISLTSVLEVLFALAGPDALAVLLVKPQFEAGRDRVGRGGVVRDPAVWGEVLLRVADHVQALGRRVLGITASPLRGPAGNVEFLLHAGPGDALTAGALARAIEVALDEGRSVATATDAARVTEPADQAEDAAHRGQVGEDGAPDALAGALTRGRR